MPEPRKLFERAAKLARLSRDERAFLARAWLLAPIAVMSLRLWGFERVLAHLERRRFAPSRRPIGVERGEALVRAAFRGGLATSSCLPESIVQYALHLETGPEPKLVIGVRKERPRTSLLEGMAAHAWIEEAEGSRREPDFAPILWLTPSGRSGSAAGIVR